MNPFLKTKFQQKLRMLTIVWAAILMSPLVLGFLVFQKTPAEPRPLSDIVNEPTALIFAVVAIGAIVASRVLSSLLLGRERLRELLKKPWTAEALAAERIEGRPVYAADEIPQFLALTEKERLTWLGLNPYFVSKVLTFALSESAAVMGFVLASQTGQPNFYLPFLALALVGLLMARPGEADFLSRVSV